MKTFVDSASRTWQLSISVDTIKRVRDILGIHLLDIAEGKIFEELSDPCKLVDTLFVICRTQAEAMGVSDEMFASAMAGDALEAASKALLDELIAFFPGKKRLILQQMLQKVETLEEKRFQKAQLHLNDPALMEKIESLLDQKSMT